jgi:hypothetical protein
MLIPGPAPPRLRDFLPGSVPGYAKQLIVIPAASVVIASGHDHHLPPPACTDILFSMPHEKI